MLQATNEGGGVSMFVAGLQNIRKAALALAGGLIEIQIAFKEFEKATTFGRKSEERRAAVQLEIDGLKEMATAMEEAFILTVEAGKAGDAQIAALEEQTKATLKLRDATREKAAALAGAVGGVEAPADNTKAVQTLIDNLQLQADTLGMTTEAVKAYKLSLLGADDATLKLAADLQEQIKVYNEQAEAIKENEKANKALRQETLDLAEALEDEGKRMFEETRTAAENYANALERVNFLQEEGAISAVTAARKVELLKKEMEDAKDASKKLEKAAQDMGNVFVSAFEDAVIKGDTFRDVLKGLLEDIQRIILRTTITEPLQRGIGGFFKTVVGALFSGAGGGGAGITAQSGGLAHGGRIGGPALVGERGPELFIPDSAGKIIPNNQIGGGGVTVNQTIEVDARGSDISREDLAAAVEEGARRGHLLIINDFMRNGQARRLI